MPNELASSPQYSNAPSARSALLVLTTSDPIYGLILMSDHSFPLSAAKHLLVIMIRSVTKDYMPEKISSFAEGTFNNMANGAAVELLPVLVLWGDISAQKQDKSASSLSSLRNLVGTRN